MTTFGTACSGVESASLAWEPIGFRAEWFSEIEPFPSAVLAHRWPQVPNLGDMMKLRHYIDLGEIAAPDVFCAGTPCQAFSVAGLRGGLSDGRGALTLEFIRVADAIDNARAAAGKPAGVHVWENVPGVLSSKDNAFGCLLAGLAGEDDPLIPPGKKWSNAGCVFGPTRTVAWRILDAQYFGVAQRRRRIFLVASGRAGFEPLAVLFESDGLRRDSAPSRSEKRTTAGATETGSDPSIGRTVVPCFWNGEQVSQTLDAVLYKGQTMPEKNRFPAVLVPEISTTMTSGSNSPSAKGAVSGRFFDENLVIAIQDCSDRVKSQNGKGWSDAGVSCTIDTTGVQGVCAEYYGFKVRRLTPTECERLQGFPDNHVRIPWRGKPAEECPDGPMYKAIGNSKAVPVVRWVGVRIKREIEYGDVGL